MLKRITVLSLAIALGGMASWSSGPTTHHAAAGQMPVGLDAQWEQPASADEAPAGGGGGGAPVFNAAEIAREAGLGMETTYR